MNQNCWEATKCGRELNGSKVKELGVCPAATFKIVNGINDGTNGGRACWVVAGTLCEGKIQGSFATKVMNCMNCNFYKEVWRENNNMGTYTPTNKILEMIHYNES